MTAVFIQNFREVMKSWYNLIEKFRENMKFTYDYSIAYSKV